ncbi:spermatogenesis associated 6-like protein [Bombina bombina]|uniref:spermatogenesis associated 6-like protein n=1 Tax=Bombina bombina TaxID=8345 RepID=UPI00235A5E9C|nr:spermatogenesis associated 6-like protein [Bombina bombina]
MPLKVVVELQIHAVTCPGVFLPEKDDIFLNVSILGQSKETSCLPAVFPLLFHDKMRFEKVFRKVVDPAIVAQHLESQTVIFELTQLTNRVGDILAFYEENTRDFLFPEPKLTPPYPGVDREVLMKAVPDFPGIAPKIEFSTQTVIKQADNCQKTSRADKHQFRRSLPNTPIRSSTSPTKSGCRMILEKNYKSPTRSARSRSPSPYTRRRMCELNKDNEQRLAHLNLGSYEFKSDADAKPPFIVRHVDNTKPVGEKASSQLKFAKTRQHSKSTNHLHEPPLRRAISFDSFQAETSSRKDHLYSDKFRSLRKGPSSVEREDSVCFPLRSSFLSSPGGSPTLDRSLVCESLQSDHNTWESINNRVRNLLCTHSAKQLLSNSISSSEADEVLERRCSSTRKSPNSSLAQRF